MFYCPRTEKLSIEMDLNQTAEEDDFSTCTNFTSFPPDRHAVVDPVSTATRFYIEDAIDCGLAPVLFVLGLGGNLMTLIVLIVQGTKKTTNIILMGMAVSNLAYIVIWYVTKVQCIIRHFDELLGINFRALMNAKLFAPLFIFGRISAFFNVLVAVERYVAVLHPLQASIVVTKGRVVFLCIFLYAFVFACGSAFFLFFDVQWKFDVERNTHVLTIVNARFPIDNAEFVRFYSGVFLPTLFCILPVVTVTFCTVSIMRVLKASLKQRSTIAVGKDFAKKSNHGKTTRALMSICILYVLCCMPNALYRIAELILMNFDLSMYENTMSVFNTFLQLLEPFNCFANFFVYVATSKKFSAVFRRSFLCSWKVRERETSDTLSQKTDSNSIY